MNKFILSSDIKETHTHTYHMLLFTHVHIKKSPMIARACEDTRWHKCKEGLLSFGMLGENTKAGFDEKQIYTRS